MRRNESLPRRESAPVSMTLTLAGPSRLRKGDLVTLSLSILPNDRQMRVLRRRGRKLHVADLDWSEPPKRSKLKSHGKRSG